MQGARGRRSNTAAILVTGVALQVLALAGVAQAQAQAQAQAVEPGLLFHGSGDKDLDADTRSGPAEPSFTSGVSVVPMGKVGGALQWNDDGYVAWRAPGNIYAQRGTLSFFWRSRTPVSDVPFNIFRTGFADHSSWDMTFLRIDWNGHGFDAFVTDANLSRIRVSWRMDTLPAADAWNHIAFSWDEAVGIRLYVDGREVARKDQKADLDSGLDAFGFAGRTVSPYQVTSAYHFMRGSDIDELRVYDHQLAAGEIGQLVAGGGLTSPGAATDPSWQAWLHRFGWDMGSPPALTARSTRIRKVEFADAKDLKERMWKGVDGIAETTWPGVYNRSRLPGRDDYFELPDWNVYVGGGKSYVLSVPPGETVNRVEIRGAAYGSLTGSADGTSWSGLAKRPAGVVRSVDTFPSRQGGALRFTNVMQEQPIQEIWAYDVAAGGEPQGKFKLEYTIDSKAAADLPSLGTLNDYIAGRFPAGERQTVVALPDAAKLGAPGASIAVHTGVAVRGRGGLPIVHILIPSNFSDAVPGRLLERGWNYGWENVADGLDGIAIDLPALHVAAGRDGLIPLNIRVKDVLWPGRDMIDVSVSVRPGEARTVWLDLRDRILAPGSMMLSIASASPDFSADALDGAKLRLVFKDRGAALAEHVADRFAQVRDNHSFIVEEHAGSKGLSLYRRLIGDAGDLLRVDPDNVEGRRWWSDIAFTKTVLPRFVQPAAPAGVPLWAFRQTEDLKLVRQYVDWWIDHRQVRYGDFGGGISDDTDLMQQWPGLALMGVMPAKINRSLTALSEAVYHNGMMVDGLGRITTDELHAYEEGMNSDAARLYLNWGDPKTLERVMATTRALSHIITRNAAGHVHFSSNWYGATKVYQGGPWSWQKPFSFTVTHGPIILGLFNGDPTARGLVTGVVDGWMAHGTRDAKGAWSYPNEINWQTDAQRTGNGAGDPIPYQTAWAAWRFSKDDRFLQPILARTVRSGPASLADINENALADLPQGKTLTAQLAAKASGGGDFARYAAWTGSGDRAWLEGLHADGIADKSQRMYLNTEGHLWTDRVEQPSDYLQRERLGGLALKRNQIYPGHSVSWAFDDPAAAEQVAILVPGATPDHFKVIGYNLTDRAQSATMTAWNVTAGTWRMTAGTSAAGGSVADGTPVPSTLTLERSASTRVRFAPHATTVMEFTLVTATTPTEARADLGIGADDVVRAGRMVKVTVHSLGATATPGGTVAIVDETGRTIASAPVPAMTAPTDLVPHTTVISLPVPAGTDLSRMRMQVALPPGVPEVTQANNGVSFAAAAAVRVPVPAPYAE